MPALRARGALFGNARRLGCRRSVEPGDGALDDTAACASATTAPNLGCPRPIARPRVAPGAAADRSSNQVVAASPQSSPRRSASAATIGKPQPPPRVGRGRSQAIGIEAMTRVRHLDAQHARSLPQRHKHGRTRAPAVADRVGHQLAGHQLADHQLHVSQPLRAQGAIWRSSSASSSCWRATAAIRG